VISKQAYDEALGVANFGNTLPAALSEYFAFLEVYC
jgi:hypothetical protein